ncbi:hypothetical protein IFM89_036504 [Coptis chinensis]|uniref:Nuclear speckle splicing regulatory protein 1 N-terminal domain-containing protein n=1 Tax=Coptis chinensis TaxID=261450 RepID=A0A835LY54_9MAGN|nr:hypothetical protein IFM89_036504 [Coptis chinensis]
MKKYGLQLRIPQQSRQPMGPPAARAPVFGDNDDDDDVNRDISRQATKKKALKDVEEQHKKALEDDPTVFDYDGVYDQMKEAAVVRPLVQDREQRQSKYIGRLMEKAKQREQEHEIIYERKLAKERSKDEHIYKDKDKYITSAYKKKLAEQEKWMQEERRRELREEKEDVTKKSDILDFYFNLSKNVAYGAKAAESSRQVEQDEIINTDASGKEVVPRANSPSNSAKANVTEQDENSPHSKENNDSLDVKSEVKTSVQDNTVAEQPPAEQKKHNPQKRKEDEVAAAKARFLARKKTKEN